jgi:hypothetical protein
MAHPPESFSHASLTEFHTNNPHSYLLREDDNLFIDNLWGGLDVRLLFDENDDNQIATLNRIRVDPRFDAIIHQEENRIEFAFGIFDPNDDTVKGWIDRNFAIHHNGNEYNCSYSEPTLDLLAIAKMCRRIPTDTNLPTMPQLRVLRDLQNQAELPAPVKSYFERNTEPRSFFVNGINADTPLEQLFRHLNFISSYYDRRSPHIVTRPDDVSKSDDETIPRPRRMLNDAFPTTLNCRQIDDVLLTLLEVAIKSPPRASFLYYYQVFEYAGHYYFDDDARVELRRILRDPSILDMPDRKLDSLFSILADLHKNEDQRMQKVIQQHCDPMNLWTEIENDKEFFSQKIVFDGGFESDAFLSADTTSNAWCEMWKTNLFWKLTKIRNCLVHARERREPNSILPTKSNNDKLKRIIPLIRRTAEDLVIRI